MNKINKISHLFQFDAAKIGQKHEYVQTFTRNTSFFLIFNHFRPFLSSPLCDLPSSSHINLPDPVAHR